jgi:hypothetical protein
VSSALYATRLWWYGNRGGAKLHGKQVLLEHAPIINGRSVVMIDYVPEIALQTIQFAAYPPRDMTRDEIIAADALLRQVTAQPQAQP